MKKIFTLPNLYVLLWALYYTQGTFIPRGSIWSRGIQVLFLLISIYFSFVAIADKKRGSYFKSLETLLLMFTIYGVIRIVVGGGVEYLQMIYLSMLPIFSFFVFTKKELIDERWIKSAFFVLAGVVVVQYLQAERTIEEVYLDADYSVVNVGYEILALLPLIYFWKEKPIVQYVMLTLLLAFVVSTVKRGAIITGALCVVYFIYNTMHNSSRKIKWYVWLVVLIFIVIGYRYLINFYANSEFAQYRIQSTLEGESSGRDSIFRRCWFIFVDSGFWGRLFGHGAYATVDKMGIAAHNDWLEILVNEGLLGVIVYFVYWINFYLTFKRDKNTETKPILGTVIIFCFMTTLFSMSYSTLTLPITLSLGYCLAKREKQPST